MVNGVKMNAKKRKVPQASLPRGFAGRITLMFMNMGHRSIYENVAEFLKPRPEDDLLEVGCGNGHFLKMYASHVHSVAGLDLSKLAVKLATKKNKERVAARTAEFIQGEASKLPWEDDHFSAVTSMGSFTGFPKPLESLKEIYRVLRPGGRAVISLEWNAEDGIDHTNNIEKYEMKMYKEEDVRTMLKEAGFSEISINYAKGLKMPKMMIACGVK
jgi:SAM-dependent methyltransferase